MIPHTQGVEMFLVLFLFFDLGAFSQKFVRLRSCSQLGIARTKNREDKLRARIC